jgi:hypothetical protein
VCIALVTILTPRWPPGPGGLCRCALIGTPGLNLKVTHPNVCIVPLPFQKKFPLITSKKGNNNFFPGLRPVPLRSPRHNSSSVRLFPACFPTERVDCNPISPEIHVHRRLFPRVEYPSLHFPDPPPVANHCGSNTLLRRPSPPPQAQLCRFILRPGFHDTLRRPITSNAGPNPNTSPYNAAEPPVVCCRGRNDGRDIASPPHPARSKNGSGTVSLAAKLGESDDDGRRRYQKEAEGYE